MRRRLTMVLAAAAIAGPAGCGGGSPDPAPSDGLAQYLPTTSQEATVVDFDGVKQQVGLPDATHFPPTTASTSTSPCRRTAPPGPTCTTPRR